MAADDSPIPPPTPPLLRLGLIADVQHADKDTVAFEGRPQRYQEAEGKLMLALATFNSLAASPHWHHHHHQQQQQQPLAAVITLGDIVDGYAGDPARSTADLVHVAGLFEAGLPDGLPVHHVLGNHCLSAARQHLVKVLRMPGSFYSVPLGDTWRLVVLDTTDMSLHSGYPEASPQAQQAQAWFTEHSAEPNAQPWNGGCSQQQLAWLEQQLEEAAAQQQQVLVATHHPVSPGSAPDAYLAWGHAQLLQLLTSRPGLVRAVFSGHYHPGGYACHKGVHFVVLEGVLEAPPDSCAFAVLDVHVDVMVVQGHGVATSRRLLL